MKIEISIGEILDKYSILEIKLKEIKDKNKLINIQKEYDLLEIYVKKIKEVHEIYNLYTNLLVVNKKLWDIEDELRNKERISDFGDEFIELARQVYITNDMRSQIKKEINLLTHSDIIEEKSYKEY